MLGLTQEKCAWALGVPKARLANYELCRAAVKADFATVFCFKFFFNELWLATGKSVPRIHLFLRFTREYTKVPPGAKFSDAFDNHLSAIARERVVAFSPEFVLQILHNFQEHPDVCFFSHALQAMFDELMMRTYDLAKAFVFKEMLAAGLNAYNKVMDDARQQAAAAKSAPLKSR